MFCATLCADCFTSCATLAKPLPSLIHRKILRQTPLQNQNSPRPSDACSRAHPYAHMHSFCATRPVCLGRAMPTYYIPRSPWRCNAAMYDA